MTDRYRDRPYPTDDSDRGYSPAPNGEGDPLAELARLIGQTDPFSNFGRDHADQRPPNGGYDRSGDDRSPNGSYGDDDGASDHGYNGNGHDPSHNEPSNDGYDDGPSGGPSWMQRRPVADTPFGARGSSDDRFGAPPADDRYSDRGQFQNGAQNTAQNGMARARAHERSQERPQENGRYDDLLFGPEQERQARAQPRENNYQDHPFGNDPYADEAEHDAPKSRRGGMATVIIVLALAIVGTAAAYAYRSFVGSPRSGEPPVFRADTGPNKIVPPSQSGDSKLSYDRVGEKAGERMVSREEQPVDIDGKPSPRVVFPAVGPNGASVSTTTTRPTGNGAVGEEPRKIRTLTIRPDQPDVAAAPAIAPPTASATAAPPRVVSPPVRTVTASNTAINTAATAPTGSNGPISLTPPTQSAPTAAEPRPRVAAINPAAATPAGGSFVQISSQKTEADAQASFRAMQGKYPDILSSRSPSIRRADLGDKGVFYRALVGPFASTDEATQFCVNLKSAGGQCIVQRN